MIKKFLTNPMIFALAFTFINLFKCSLAEEYVSQHMQGVFTEDVMDITGHGHLHISKRKEDEDESIRYYSVHFDESNIRLTRVEASTTNTNDDIKMVRIKMSTTCDHLGAKTKHNYYVMFPENTVQSKVTSLKFFIKNKGGKDDFSWPRIYDLKTDSYIKGVDNSSKPVAEFKDDN